VGLRCLEVPLLLISHVGRLLLHSLSLPISSKFKLYFPFKFYFCEEVR
jgi:hypothetical protein